MSPHSIGESPTSQHNSFGESPFSRQQTANGIANRNRVSGYGAMDLMEKVSRLLEKQGRTQAELARALKVDPGRITRWANGTGQPKPLHLLEMARFFGVCLESLIDDRREPAPPPELTDDEKYILRTVRELGLPKATQRLLHEAPTRSVEPETTYEAEERKASLKRRPPS